MLTESKEGKVTASKDKIAANVYIQKVRGFFAWRSRPRRAISPFLPAMWQNYTDLVAILLADTGITDKLPPTAPAVFEIAEDGPVEVEVIVDVVAELDDSWTVTTFVVGDGAEALDG